jgi:hypothetical protein
MSGRLTRRLVAVAVALCLAVAACSGRTKQQAICAEHSQRNLLSARLEPWVPSPAFTVAPETTAWVRVTKLPVDADGLFGTVGGVAQLHTVQAATPPQVVTEDGNKVAKDPFVVIKQASQWQLLPLEAGTWRIYSVTNPAIEVVACPED